MESEVARIRKQIEEECEALRQMTEGFAIGASHQAIMTRYEQLSSYHKELERVVGPQASNILSEVYVRILG